MNKRFFGFLFGVVLLGVAVAGPVGEVWRAYMGTIETQRLQAAAAAADARAGLVVAEGEAAILEEAARAVAADRQLVTLYAVSGNVAVLGAVLLGGLVAGVLFGRARKNGGDGNV